MDTNQQDEGGAPLAGDLLVGADAIRTFLVHLGMPEETDPYYLKQSGSWPIGNTAGDGGKLIASKRRLTRHTDKLARGPTAALKRRAPALSTPGLLCVGREGWRRPVDVSEALKVAAHPARRTAHDAVV